MFKIYYIILFVFVLTGCIKESDYYQHQGEQFKIATENILAVSTIDSNYNQFIRKKLSVRIRGKIKYQDTINGTWAFVEDMGDLVFVNFEASSPNIHLPAKQLKNDIAIEGYLVKDETVLNNYHLVPYGYEFILD